MAWVDEAFLTKLPFSEEGMSWCDNIEANLAQTLEPKFSAMYVSQLERKRTYPHWLHFIKSSKNIHLLLGIQCAIFQRLHGITQLLCISLFLCLVCSLTNKKQEETLTVIHLHVIKSNHLQRNIAKQIYWTGTTPVSMSFSEQCYKACKQRILERSWGPNFCAQNSSLWTLLRVGAF